MKCVSSRIACLDFPWDFFSFSCKVCSVNKGNTCYLAVLLLPPVYVCCAWNQCQNLTYLLFWWCKKPLWKGQANGYGVVFDLNYAPGCWCCPPRKHIQGSILVFIPGGRGKDKAWIITFPDNSRFNDVPEETVTKVLTYLTSVPRYVAPFQLSPVICSVGLTRVGHGIFSATPRCTEGKGCLQLPEQGKKQAINCKFLKCLSVIFNVSVSAESKWTSSLLLVSLHVS